MLITTGLRAFGAGDGIVHAPHRPASLRCEAQDLHVRHLRMQTTRDLADNDSFISENPVVAKIQYWMKICFVFILILFIDSVNRVYRVQIELLAASEQAHKGSYVTAPPETFQLTRNSAAGVMGHERLEVQARKFYSQRNMYLCGFTLFLSLILNRTYVMILEVMRLEDRLKSHEGTNKDTKQAEKLAVAGKPGELAHYKELAEKREQDLKNLQKQSKQLHDEYDALSDKYAALQKETESSKDR
ncbi:hypothetical protein Golomagni_08334 [Golovinomyces magnicellulatus]|nr:hypothetical protein Golomagni_08334 [Golovinomyces magnicellulatus]